MRTIAELLDDQALHASTVSVEPSAQATMETWLTVARGPWQVQV